MTSQKSIASLRDQQFNQKFVIRDDEKVRAFLESHDFIATMLSETHRQIDRYFPKSPVALQVFADPDDTIDNEQLVASIAVKLPPDEALKKLDQLGEAWGLAAMDRAKGKLCITVEFI